MGLAVCWSDHYQIKKKLSRLKEIEVQNFSLIFVVSYVIDLVINFIGEIIMGAIAVSKNEEEQIERLRKELKIPSKSGLIRAALKALEKKTEEDKLRREILESVRRCGAADKEENQELLNAGIARAGAD